MVKKFIYFIFISGCVLINVNGLLRMKYLDTEVQAAEVEMGENLLVNGDFSEGNDYWQTWNGEGGDSSLTIENGIAEIEIHSIAGMHPEWGIPISWSTQFFQSDVELLPSATYELVIRAWSSVDRPIEIEYEGPEGTSRVVNLSTNPEEYIFTFSSLSARTLQLNFLLGNVINEDLMTPEEPHSVYFEYITLTEIEGEEIEAPERNWELVWSEEFENTELDRSVWNIDIGNGQAGGLEGWGNNELQYYTDNPNNIRIEDGRLILEAHEETVTDEYGTFDYTSGKITTENNFSQTYGRFEASIKLPSGQGFWPAFWMMPQEDVYGGWAASGEIDIMENRGSETDEVGAAFHYGGEWPENTHSGGAYHFPEGQTTTDFNLYSLEWEPGEIRWYVNDDLYYIANEWYSTNGEYPAPFDQEFFMILNLAVGGWYGGNPDETTQFPVQMEVDYVRVYRESESDNNEEPSELEETVPEDGDSEDEDLEEGVSEETGQEETNSEETEPKEVETQEVVPEETDSDEVSFVDTVLTKDDSGRSVSEHAIRSGERLPQTATATWTVGLVGGISLLTGILTKIRRKK